jgi:hypothetical protein
MCHLVTRWNNIHGIHTPDDFVNGYRRKYLINTHRVDPYDIGSADRYIEALRIWNLPSLDPRRARYAGDYGWRILLSDLEATTTKPVPW